MMNNFILILSIFFSAVVYGETAAINVHTYASQPRFHDSVNTHWIETEKAIIVIDAQRLISESRQAIRHIQSLAKPVEAIFVTHAHSDHYGGLPSFRQAFPDAKVFSNLTTIESIRHDNRGYTKARKSRLGNDFPSQESLLTALPNQVVKDGQRIKIDGLTIEIRLVSPGEAEESMVLYLPDQNILFVGDHLNNGFVPAPLESLDGWLLTLDKWEQLYSHETLVYPGHGPEDIFDRLLIRQRQYLLMLRDKVRSAITDGHISATAVEEIAIEIERAFPHWHGVGGNPRFEVIKFVIEQVALQYGAKTESQTRFR